SRQEVKCGPAAEVACFGMITPAVVMIVDELPEHNTGMRAKVVQEFISDDAAVIAMLLRGWDVRSGLIGTTLGDDDAGRKVARQLHDLGVIGQMRLSGQMTTPFEVNVSDRTGARTYFWQRDPEVLATLATADLSLLSHTRLLYVDWYDGDYILRPLAEARRLGIPTFLNLEYGHEDPDVLSRYVAHATICQTVTDAAQMGGDPLVIAQKVLHAGAETAIVTLGEQGCLVARHGESLRAWAPTVEVVDGCGAGATFSAGMIYGHLQRWDLEAMTRFAIAAASLKCTVVGPQAFPLSDIHPLANQVKIERDELVSRQTA
ncbi:MAG: carbohydrate kinase family protein, partial [Candidatus Tectomicrobia bacterium]|nr:carbohydrate kinase family protein [Candidatus Tectomicrobia bacterium]